jgi:hypothetical protein
MQGAKMTNMSNTSMTLADLERLLDVYGGDRTRWPADSRAGAAQLAARDAKAGRLLAEAEALDRVLGRAPLPALASEGALADRIVAAAQRSPRIVKIAAAEQVSRPDLAAGASTSQHGPSRGLRRAEVRAAGLLAAALVAGVVIGASNLPQEILAGMASTVDRYNLAQADPFDEDVL